MANNNVRFIKVTLQTTYDALTTKDANALYFVQDTNRFYHADRLMGTGALAGEFAGLMSPEDKKKLDELISGGVSGLSPVDGTIVLTDTDDGGKQIGVAIATDAGNALVAVEGGLFVPAVKVPEYAIEKQETANEGYAVSYKLKKTVGEEVSYVGDAINIPKDMVLKSATIETVAEADKPYTGAVVGDPYIHMVFNDAAASDIFVPVKGLVDTYTAGDGIAIENNVVSVRIADNAHGLTAVDGALTINLATAENDGAMSAADKAALDGLIALNIAENCASKEEVQAISDRVTIVEQAYSWSEM